MTTPLPYPSLVARYASLAKRPSSERLAEAENLLSGAELASEFNEAAEEYESFETSQPFFPCDPERDEGKDPQSDARTYGWAMRMKAQDEVEVDGDRSLNFHYVEREIVPTRTRPARPFTDPAGTQVRVDLVLANALSGRPIISELKIGNDKDPFTGLVQALAGAAQLRSLSQRDRLCQLPWGSHLAATTEEPLIDIYVLLADFPATGRHWFEQRDTAIEIAENLESRSLCDGLGRIRILILSETKDTISAATIPSSS